MSLALAALLVAAGEPTTVAGTVRASHDATGTTVAIIDKSGVTTILTGELAPEVGTIAGTVEVLGTPDRGRLLVQTYRILDLGGGVRPTAVGTLVETAAGLGIAAAEGGPMPLSASPRMREKLERQRGAKVWVVGEKLLSGEIKVTRFGVLREAPAGAPAAK